jgi:hypothetical protein
MNKQDVRPEEFVELIDKLIMERLKVHQLNSSANLNHNIDKRSMLQGFDQRIALIKSRLAEILNP